MRKILLLLIMISFGFHLSSQDLSSITGPKNPKSNSSSTYTIWLDGNYSSSLEVVIASNYGSLDKAGGPTMITRTPSIVGNKIDVTVYWPDIEKSDGHIIAYKKTGTGKTISLTGIKISKNGSNENEVEKVTALPFPSIIEGEPFKLGFLVPSKGNYEIKSYKYNTNYFYIVEKTKHDITFVMTKFPPTSGTEMDIEIVIEERYLWGLDIPYRLNYTWGIGGSLIGLPIISKTEDCACNGEIIRYEIKTPYYSYMTPFSDAKAQWQAGTNLTLISSGDKWATFRVSGNGAAIAKAKVTAGGRNFDLQNSDVWVGLPSISGNISSLNGLKNGGSTISSAFSAEFSLTTQRSENTIKWTANGTEYSNYKGDYFMFRVPYHGKQVFFYEVKAYPKNKCGIGSAKTFSFSVNPNNPGGGQVILKNESQLLQDNGNIIDETDYSLKVYDLSGRLVYTNAKVSGSFNLSNTSLDDGVYILEKSDGNETTREKVMLKR